MNTNFKSIEKAIKSNGWERVRVNGSHYQYRKEGVSHTITIPYHGKANLSIGVIKNLELRTGLSLRR